jgi:spermidine/putrescine transport system ATP-binding protein
VLDIRNIGKRFGSQTALSGFNLEVRDGEFLSLLGPSGCGKTTLLNIIAGFESADQGEVLWRGNRVDQIPARLRPFHMVFQGYALFPHLNVFENVAFALRLKKLSDNDVQKRVKETLELVGLTSFEKRSVETLSGGQAQRVAVARALAPRPDIVLLDEPMSALDRQLRARMQAELRLLQKRLKLTFILVTHDQEEALSVSDRVALLHDGHLEQVGTPEEIYLEPKTNFVASFVGSRNCFSGQTLRRDGNTATIRLRNGQELVGIAGNGVDGKGHIQGFICPEHVRLKPAVGAVTLNHLKGRVLESIFRGESKEVWVDTEAGFPIRLRLEQDQVANVGDNVAVELPPEMTHLFVHSEKGSAL